MIKECRVSRFSRRICEKGTEGCLVTHRTGEKLTCPKCRGKASNMGKINSMIFCVNDGKCSWYGNRTEYDQLWKEQE